MWSNHYFLKPTILFLGIFLLIHSCRNNKVTDPVKVENRECQPWKEDTLYFFNGFINQQFKDFTQTGYNDTITSHVGVSNIVRKKDYSFFKYSCSIGIVSSFDKDEVFKEELTLLIGTIKEFSVPDATDTLFFDLFQIGRYPFSNDAAHGIEIKYVDPQKKLWSTSLGTQKGSEFVFTEINKEEGLRGAYVLFKARLNCKLYDGSGNFKVLSNAKMMNVFENI